jgi:hypothetical protein
VRADLLRERRLLGNIVSSVDLTPTLKLSLQFGVSLCSLSPSMERPSPFAKAVAYKMLPALTGAVTLSVFM